MRPLRYSINVTLDGCCDHRVMIADEESQARGGDSVSATVFHMSEVCALWEARHGA